MHWIKVRTRNFYLIFYGFHFYLVLENEREIPTQNTGLFLFPTLLKGELHGARKTVEEFNNKRRIGRLGENLQVVYRLYMEIPRKSGLVLGMRMKTVQVSRC